MNKPTKEETRERAELWAKALEANDGKECRDALRDSSGGRCCLQVAADVFCEATGTKSEEAVDMEQERPTKVVVSWFGWPISTYSKDPLIGNMTAIQLNDAFELRHKDIARRVREAFGCETNSGS